MRTLTEAEEIVKLKTADLDYSIGVLIDALNEVAKVHPIIAGALDLFTYLHSCNVFTSSKGVVVVFSAVYKLENTRRENDQKVDLLYAEMRDMLHVLLQYGQLYALCSFPSRSSFMQVKEVERAGQGKGSSPYSLFEEGRRRHKRRRECLSSIPEESDHR